MSHGADADALADVTRDRRPEAERLRVQERQLPARQLAQEPRDRAGSTASAGLELQSDRAALPARAEELRVDPDRDQRVVALEALGRGLGRRGRGREQRVDARAQAIARERRGGYESRSAEKKVAAVSACVEVSAR